MYLYGVLDGLNRFGRIFGLVSVVGAHRGKAQGFDRAAFVVRACRIEAG